MFKSARIKLTAHYLLIIMIITISLSAIVYSSITAQTERSLRMYERRVNNRFLSMPNPLAPPWEPIVDEKTVKEMRKNTLVTLSTINIFILFVAGVSGYWLAGRTLRPIEEMVEKQKKFTTDAAHELKTPLTAIKTYLEVNLRKKKLDLKDAKEIISSTVQDIDSLTILTNSLLKQSKYQNYSDNNKEDFDLKDLIKKIIEKMKHSAKDKKITIRLSGENINMKTNKSNMSELIIILIDNAIKFNEDGGSIDINLEKNGNFAYIKVKDTGIGIDEKDIPYVFDRFYKVDESRTKTENNGFGLGLSIAKEIVESNKGNISVKSERDVGTTFTIKLPIK